MKPIPYPAETRAKGWRFELDMERARQSDTWTLASPDVRPWLLMLWATAWEQTPCGSMPDDDELIAAKIGMSAKAFAKHKAILLRRWWKAEDGRLYQDVLVQRATEMVEARGKTAQRVAKYKALRGEERTANALPLRDYVVKNGTGTGTGFIHTHGLQSERLEFPKAWGDWAVENFPHWTANSVEAEAGLFAAHYVGKAFDAEGWLTAWCKWCRDPITQHRYRQEPPKRTRAEKAETVTVPSDAAERTAAELARQEAEYKATKADPVAQARIAEARAKLLKVVGVSA